MSDSRNRKDGWSGKSGCEDRGWGRKQMDVANREVYTKVRVHSQKVTKLTCVRHILPPHTTNTQEV